LNSLKFSKSEFETCQTAIVSKSCLTRTGKIPLAGRYLCVGAWAHVVGGQNYKRSVECTLEKIRQYGHNPPSRQERKELSKAMRPKPVDRLRMWSWCSSLTNYDPESGSRDVTCISRKAFTYHI